MSAMQRSDLCIISALLLAGLATQAVAGKSDYVVKDPPAKLEKVEGSDLPRVVLTEKAAERTGIQFAPVREEKVRRWLIVGGKVEAQRPLPKGQEGYTVAATRPGPGSGPVRVSVPMVAAWMAGTHSVRVLFSDDVDDAEDDLGQLDDEDDDHAVIIIVLPESTKTVDGGISIRQAEMSAVVESGDAVNLIYAVEGNFEGLKTGDHVPVKFSRPESSGMRKVVPYSAVLYDARGNAWLYTSPEPLVFVRQPITVDFVEGERAVLKEGPAAGTLVVKTGAAELFGVEHKIGH